MESVASSDVIVAGFELRSGDCMCVCVWEIWCHVMYDLPRTILSPNCFVCVFLSHSTLSLSVLLSLKHTQ